MKQRIFIVSLFVAYTITTTAAMILLGIGITLDRYFFVLFLGALLIKRARSFLLDWGPFLLILLSYEFLRGFAADLGPRVNFLPQIKIDQFIFGQVPTIVLQKLFYDPKIFHWYDYFATILYFGHFVLPLSFAYILWIYKKQYFREFLTGISILSYGAWITFLIFPTAPPWMAAEKGYIPHMTKILDHILGIFPQRLDVPTVYHYLNPNPVAAVPSLHAAYPFLVFLSAIYFFGARALFFLPYVFAVWVAIVYLGEHYVADIIFGVIYSLLFFWVTKNFLHKRTP